MSRCPICDAVTEYLSNGTPDADWGEAVVAHTPDPPPDPETIPAIGVDAISMEFGQTWVHAEALERFGYIGAQVGDIIRVQGKVGDIFFEIAGPAIRKNKRGRQEKLPGWWLIRVDIPEVPDAPPVWA